MIQEVRGLLSRRFEQARTGGPLVDITGMNIQSQDIAQPFSAFMATPGIRSRKLAFVCGTSLSRLQASRLTDRDHVNFFTNTADALACLVA